jgi:hypothetical protein
MFLVFLVPSRGLSQIFDTIVPGDRIGQLRLTSNLADIRKALGPESAQLPGSWDGTTLHAWEPLALEAQADDATGNLIVMHIGVPSGQNPWAEFKTGEGLGIASREEEVVRILGTPARTPIDTGRGWKLIGFPQRGITFLVATGGPLAGKVIALDVYWKYRALGDAMVVPGDRISVVKLGMTAEQVVATVGGGYIQHRSEGVYFWPHTGLILHLPNSVDGIGAFRAQWLEDAGVEYRTARGLGWMNTAQQVRTALGEPTFLQQIFERDFITLGGLDPSVELWIYPSGIGFALDAQAGVVLGVFVFVFCPSPQPFVSSTCPGPQLPPPRMPPIPRPP